MILLGVAAQGKFGPVAAYDPTAPRRTFGAESAWFPVLDALGPRGLRRALIAAGLSPQVAGGVVWFLDDQRHLDRAQGQSTRTRYRRALDGLDPAAVAELAKPARARKATAAA